MKNAPVAKSDPSGLFAALFGQQPTQNQNGSDHVLIPQDVYSRYSNVLPNQLGGNPGANYRPGVFGEEIGRTPGRVYIFVTRREYLQIQAALATHVLQQARRIADLEAAKKCLDLMAHTGQVVVDLGTSFAPIVGEARDWGELLTGVDFITGERLSVGSRIATGIGGLLPIIPGRWVRRGWDWVSGLFRRASRRHSLLAELAQQGVRHTPENVIAIARDASGRIIFLEMGNAASGLQHILQRHASDFAARGIPQDQLADAIMAAVTRGTVVGQVGSGANVRRIYEVSFGGRTQRIAVGIGSNGSPFNMTFPVAVITGPSIHDLPWCRACARAVSFSHRGDVFDNATS